MTMTDPNTNSSAAPVAEAPSSGDAVREEIIAALKAKEALVKSERESMGFGDQYYRPLYHSEIVDALLPLLTPPAAEAVIASLKAENDRLAKERAWIENDAGKLQARAEAAEAQVATLTAALEPLAAMDVVISKPEEPIVYAFDAWADEAAIFDIGSQRRITAGDLRRARASLASQQEG
jgi:hypothetical protein